MKKASLSILAVSCAVSLASWVITDSRPIRLIFRPTLNLSDAEFSHSFEPGSMQVVAEAGLLSITHCGAESQEFVTSRQIEAGLFFWSTSDCGYGSGHLPKTFLSFPLFLLAVGPWGLLLLGRMHRRSLKLLPAYAAEKVRIPSTARSTNVACGRESDAEFDLECGVRHSGGLPGQRRHTMKSSVISLTVAVAVLTTLQVVPPSLRVSIAQITITGALLVWFVGFSLKRA